jgi:hypothetical protein
MIQNLFLFWAGEQGELGSAHRGPGSHRESIERDEGHHP